MLCDEATLASADFSSLPLTHVQSWRIGGGGDDLSQGSPRGSPCYKDLGLTADCIEYLTEKVMRDIVALQVSGTQNISFQLEVRFLKKQPSAMNWIADGVL